MKLKPKQVNQSKEEGDVSLSMGAMAMDSPIDDALMWRVNRIYDAVVGTLLSREGSKQHGQALCRHEDLAVVDDPRAHRGVKKFSHWALLGSVDVRSRHGTGFNVLLDSKEVSNGGFSSPTLEVQGVRASVVGPI